MAIFGGGAEGCMSWFSDEASDWLFHVVVHGKDFVERVFIGVDVHHPAEDDGLEAAKRCVAHFFGGDAAFEAELAPIGVAELPPFRHAKIGVQMPLGNAERHSCDESLDCRALRRGVKW